MEAIIVDTLKHPAEMLLCATSIQHLKYLYDLFIYVFIYTDFREREEGRGRETSICCSTYLYLCIQWLILVCAVTGIKPENLVYQDKALTN